MRGSDCQQQMMFSYISPKARVPKNHPLRPIQAMANRALKELSPIFKEMYSRVGRRSIAPEKLLRSLLIQILYSIRSERMLVEQLEYNLLFRWFVGLSMDEPIWNHSTYSKNRDRILDTDIAVAFLRQITRQAEEAGLLSDEHFTVDGTLIEAWASLKSLRPRNTDSPDQGGGVTLRLTSMARNVVTTPMHQRLIRTRGYTEREKAKKPSSRIWVMSSWKTEMGLWLIPE